MNTAPPSPLATPRPWDLVAEGYVEENLPVFEAFAREALRLCPAHGDVLDVAAGPGSLSLLAAQSARIVHALDFSPAMLAALAARAAAMQIQNVQLCLGDGMALPYAEAAFDVAYSLFGLIFFPDRAKGLRELSRVLRPGGRLLVASWPPVEHMPIFSAIFAALAAERPGPAPAALPPALATPEDIRAELGAAGFSSIEVHAHSIGMGQKRPADIWRSFARGGAPVALLRDGLDAAAFAALYDRVSARIVAALGPEPIEVRFMALIGLGTCESARWPRP